MEEQNKITIHQIIWYLLIFSVIGLIIETLFCFITTGVWESRKGLIYGPFCPVYGIGATLLIIILNSFYNNKFKLFVYGGICGSAIEYIMSFVLEAFYGTRFWDYSYLRFNLNGRICITYTIFWGILALLLIAVVKPCIDKGINSFNIRYFKILDIAIIVFVIVDIICTVWGIQSYKKRAISSYYGINQNNKNSVITNIENKIFPNKKMRKIFPNLRYINERGDEIWIRDII